MEIDSAKPLMAHFNGEHVAPKAAAELAAGRNSWPAIAKDNVWKSIVLTFAPRHEPASPEGRAKSDKVSHRISPH